MKNTKNRKPKPPLTEEQKRQRRNSHLLRTYNRTLEEYEEMLADQDGGCFICGIVPAEDQNSLSLDHDHSWKKVKVSKEKRGGMWYASAVYRGDEFSAEAKNRQEAVHIVKRLMLRASCRGLLCVWCNRGLRFYHDNPKLLHRAAIYLERLEKDAG